MGKIVKKILIEDSWQISRNESWFSDMAAKGLHLKSIGRLFAVFEKGEPREIKYCTAILDKSPSQQEINSCKAGGWELAASRGKFYFFSSEQSDNELASYMDMTKQKDTICSIERQLKKNLILVSILMLVFFGIMFSILFRNDKPFLSMITGGLIQQILLVAVELYVFYTVIRNFIWIRTLRKSLLEGKRIFYKVNWKKHRLLNSVIRSLFLIIALFMIVIPILHMIKSESYTLPEAKTDLSIIRLAEIEQNPELKREVFYNSRGVDWGNRVSYDWSFLAPIQLATNEHGIVSDVMWKDNSGEYSPSIHTQFYQLTFNKMTNGLLRDLMKQYLYEPDIVPRQIENTSFDQIYVAIDDTKKQIFASWENKVIYIRYQGNKDIDDIIAIISKMP